jgi:hypothetical protein
MPKKFIIVQGGVFDVTDCNSTIKRSTDRPKHFILHGSDPSKRTLQNPRVHIVGLKIDPERLVNTTMVVLYRTGQCFRVPSFSTGKNSVNNTFDSDEPKTGVVEYRESVNRREDPESRYSTDMQVLMHPLEPEASESPKNLDGLKTRLEV